MPESRRKLIRQRIKELLTGKTAAGDRIYTNVATPIGREQLPAIAIFYRSETLDAGDTSPREYTRNLQVAIECMAEGAEEPNVDDGSLVTDILDQMADDVETELSRDERLGELPEPPDGIGKHCALVDELTLTNTEFQFDYGEMPTGSVRLIWNVRYNEARPRFLSEQEGIGDLKTIGVDWAIDPDFDQNSPEAQDVVAIPQS